MFIIGISQSGLQGLQYNICVTMFSMKLTIRGRQISGGPVESLWLAPAAAKS